MVRDFKQFVSRTEPYPKSNRGNRRKIFKRSYLYWLTAIFLICIILVSIQTGGKTEVFVTQYGRLADEFPGRGIIVRNEEVIYAPYSGQVTFLVADKERVAAGVPILEFEGSRGKKTFYSNEPGVVSFRVDGLENNLRPDIIWDLNQNYQTFKGKSIQLTDGERINAGRPLYKIVDNTKVYFLIEAPADQVFRYSIGTKVWVTFDGLTIIGWVRKIDDHQNLFVIELERFPNELIDKRWVDATVLSDAETGVYVPRTAIVRKDDEYGVYWFYNNSIHFAPVELKGGNLEYVVIASELDRGMEILANPQKDLTKFLKEAK